MARIATRKVTTVKKPVRKDSHRVLPSTKVPPPTKKKAVHKEPKKASIKAIPISKKAVKKVASGPKGYTAAEYKKFQEQKKRLQDNSNQELKDMLKKNLQSMSGNKSDLILKIADGIVLGRIPRCPNCFGGRPKFDFKAGTYYCSGYRDDTDFKNCHSTFQMAEIKRDPWE